MEYRHLGQTGVKVSSLCLGTMMFGGQTDEAESIRIIHKAMADGINFIDTADIYNAGESEVVVGKAIADRRDRVVLRPADPIRSDPWRGSKGSNSMSGPCPRSSNPGACRSSRSSRTGAASSRGPASR